MLSKSAKNAIRAVEFLVSTSNENNKFRVIEIAESLEIPQPYLSKIMQNLSKEAIVSSAKGPNGGFYIGATNRNKSLWDVVLCIDGDVRFQECLLGTPNCSEENPCSVHGIAVEYRTNLINLLKNKKIDWLIENKEP